MVDLRFLDVLILVKHLQTFPRFSDSDQGKLSGMMSIRVGCVKTSCYLRHYECVQTPFLHINWLAMLGEFVVAAQERTPIHCLWVVSVTICNSAFMWNGLKWIVLSRMLNISSAIRNPRNPIYLDLFFCYRFFGFNAISAQWSQGYLCQMSISRHSISPEGARRQGSVCKIDGKSCNPLIFALSGFALYCNSWWSLETGQ